MRVVCEWRTRGAKGPATVEGKCALAFFDRRGFHQLTSWLLHASVAHFDVLYFNLRVAGVPLFKADRGAPPVMGVLPIYRSTTLTAHSHFRGAVHDSVAKGGSLCSSRVAP